MFTCSRSTREAPSFAPVAQTDTPQTFSAHSPPLQRAGGRDAYHSARVHHRPTQIRQVSSRLHITGVQTLVPLVYLLISLTGPDPSGSTGPIRLRQGRLPSNPPIPAGQTALSFIRPL